MRKLKTFKEEIEREYIDEVCCNKCGKKISEDHSSEEYVFFRGGSLHASFGYGSVFDNHDAVFDLCDDCYSDLIASFSIPPDFSNF